MQHYILNGAVRWINFKRRQKIAFELRHNLQRCLKECNIIFFNALVQSIQLKRRKKIYHWNLDVLVK